MISDITGISLVEEDNLYIDEAEKNLGRDDFLKLFLAQMNHQDPLNPMDSSEFSSQLAQFSSLEQLFNVNGNLESMISAQDGSSRFQALELIGKEIEADGDVLSFSQGASAGGGFSIENQADCLVAITDANGYFVKKIYMGPLDAGDHSFEWDGHDEEGNIMDDGLYGFEVSAIDQSGQEIYVETKIKGIVERVNLDAEQPLLYVGEMPIALSQVIDVNLPESEI